MAKNITQLTSKTTLTDSNIFVVNDGATDYKINVGVMKDQLGINAANVGLTSKVSKTNEAWQTASLLNGWSGNLQFKKTDNNIVFIRGSLSTVGTTANNTILFTLPSGYRPLSVSVPVPTWKGNVSPYDMSLLFIIDGGGNFKAGVNNGLTQGQTSASLNVSVCFLAE